jgi:predicted AAA+ superfamily ATPase
MYIREQTFHEIGKESTFLWGARQTGKSTLLKTLFPESTYFDLLLIGPMKVRSAT